MENRVHNYYIQILSPVHVGSGVRLRNGLDYFAATGRTWMINQAALEKDLVQRPEALLEFANGDQLDIRALAARCDINLDQIIKTSYRGEAAAQDMFEFSRTGRGLPFLPGSSIKGALRTALLWSLSQEPQWQAAQKGLLQTVLNTRDTRFGGQALVEKAFHLAQQKKSGKEPNFDLMRVIHVGDAHFLPADLELADTRIFNLVNEDSGGWKDLTRRRNVERASEATQLAVEGLRVGAVAKIAWQVDDFLIKSKEVSKTARFSEYEDCFKNLPIICNQYAARQIEKQLLFAEKYKLIPLVKFYTDLQQTLKTIREGDFLLRLSWGSGWQGMTGELIEDFADLNEIRDRFHLGKYKPIGSFPEACPMCGSTWIKRHAWKNEIGYCKKCSHEFEAKGATWKQEFPIFPKTRKIVLIDGQPKYPLGWTYFSKAALEAPPAEDRSRFHPPALKKEFALQESKNMIINAFKTKEKPKLRIRQWDKLHAEVIKLDGQQVQVRLLEKDEGRVLILQESYLPPLKAGDRLMVSVEKTNSSGDEITKIKFKCKIK